MTTRRSIDWWKVAAMTGIGLVFAVLLLTAWRDHQIAAIPPAGRALSKRDPALARREMLDVLKQRDPDRYQQEMARENPSQSEP